MASSSFGSNLDDESKSSKVVMFPGSVFEFSSDTNEVHLFSHFESIIYQHSFLVLIVFLIFILQISPVTRRKFFQIDLTCHIFELFLIHIACVSIYWNIYLHPLQLIFHSRYFHLSDDDFFYVWLSK